jgi:uncharacterized damage-inducible protein DinB
MSQAPLDTAPLPGYPEPYGTLLASLQRQTGAWRQQLGEPTQEEILWQPRPNGHSIGALMLHLAEVETYWIDTVVFGRDLSPEERETYLSAHMDPFTGLWPAPPREPFAYYREILERARAHTLERVHEFGDPLALGKSEWGTHTLRWILHHLIWHESYHGGQMVLLQSLARTA